MCKFDAKQVKFEEDDYNVSHRRTREFGAERGSSSVAKRRRMQESESGQEFGCRRQTRPSEVRKKDILTLTDIKGAI